MLNGRCFNLTYLGSICQEIYQTYGIISCNPPLTIMLLITELNVRPTIFRLDKGINP